MEENIRQEDPYIVFNNINTVDTENEEEDYDDTEEDNNFSSGNIFVKWRGYGFNRNRNVPSLTDGTYTGEYKDGLFHGKGLLIDNDYNTFEGDFRNGYLHGKATILYNSGIKYSGYVKYDKYHGQGKLILNNNSFYEGDFEDGVKDGYGVYILENGDKYEGNFVNDKYGGKGVFTYKDDPKFKSKKGEWVHGLLDGDSEITYKDGSFYKGYTSDSIPYDEGEFYGSNRNLKYKGSYHNGLYEGEGILNDDEGNKIYFGKFRNNLYHGYGEEYNENEIIYYGYYKKGVKNGVGKLKVNNDFVKKYFINGEEITDFQNNLNNISSNNTCSICWEGFDGNNDSENGIVNLNCKHYFHHKCLEAWISRNPSCPICRKETNFIEEFGKKRKFDSLEIDFNDDDGDY